MSLGPQEHSNDFRGFPLKKKKKTILGVLKAFILQILIFLLSIKIAVSELLVIPIFLLIFNIK